MKTGKLYQAFGKEKTLLEWASDPMCRVPLKTLRNRIGRGYSIEDALIVTERRAGDHRAKLGCRCQYPSTRKRPAPPRTETIDLTRLTPGQREMYHTLLREEKKDRRFYQGSAAEYYRLVTATDYTSASPLSPNYHMAS